MSDTRASKLPGALRIVAVIQLLTGLDAVMAMLGALARGHFLADFDVLSIPIGVGLLRLRSGWRTCALVVLWLRMITLPVAFVWGLGVLTRAHVRIGGILLAEVSPMWLYVTAFLAFLLTLWQYRVLVRPEIVALFPRAAPDRDSAPARLHEAPSDPTLAARPLPAGDGGATVPETAHQPTSAENG